MGCSCCAVIKARYESGSVGRFGLDGCCWYSGSRRSLSVSPPGPQGVGRSLSATMVSALVYPPNSYNSPSRGSAFVGGVGSVSVAAQAQAPPTHGPSHKLTTLR